MQRRMQHGMSAANVLSAARTILGQKDRISDRVPRIPY
jgi:hypothetical protein